MKSILAIIFFILLLSFTHAQQRQVEGRLVDAKKKTPLYGAYVRLINQKDTSSVVIAPTDTAGYFSFHSLRNGSYKLEASFIGYEKLNKVITVSETRLNLGALTMTVSAIPLKEVLIEEQAPRAIQKGDTTEFTAQAFKVNKDASAEDLVTKMPGVTVENGTVKAQGENVQQVLVDGRQFFGSDPTVALRNMPAEVIDKIQVYDKMSDQAQFTGFDDGRSVKTMNIVTRMDRRQGQFGRFNAGYGTDNRYVTSGNLNNFSADSRLSILLLTNNLNQQNFAMQDLLGVMGGGGGFSGGGGMRGGGPPGGGRPPGNSGGGGQMRFDGGGSNFFVGQQSGTSTVHSFGLNYSDSLSGALFASGSYFFNLTDNANPQSVNRNYTLSEDSSSAYNEQSESEKKNYNHRLNLRMEYALDTSNTFAFIPQISFQDNTTTSSVLGSSSNATSGFLNRTANMKETNTDGYSSDNRFIYRHRFPTPGRTVSVDFGFGKNSKQSDGALNSEDSYFSSGGNVSDTVLQQSDLNTRGYSLSSNLAYTEPIGTTTQLQLNYNPSYSKNSSEKRTYDYDPVTSTYSALDSRLSNSYENTYTTQSTGISYRIRVESFNLSFGASYQIADLDNQQTFPNVTSLSKTFYSLLPNMMLNYELPQRNGLRVFYRASTTSPSISQLQNVIDNTTPLFLSSGNPDLKQSYTHSFLTRLSFSGTENLQSIMLFFNLNFTNDYIGNSTLYAYRDTLLPNNITLNRGAQLTIPVNVDRYWSVRSFATYGFPISFLKSNFNLNAGVTYTRTPGILNGTETATNVYGLSPGFVLGSNISEDLDFTLSYNANFNNSKNSLQTELDNSYFTHNAGFKCNWTFWEGIVLKNEVSNSLYSGLTSSLNQNYWLWNVSIGKKLFENQRGEIALSVVDLLDQNTSITRTVTETYIEDTQTQALQRYFLLTFTYNLRQFTPRSN